MPEIIIVAALAANRVIGKGDRIPWHISEDFKRFKDLTMGFPVIMGRKTWESLPKKPLPGRRNIILTSQQEYSAPGAEIRKDLAEALAFCGDAAKVFIIGGARVYQDSFPYATAMELTHLLEPFEGDVFFPPIDPEIWKVANESPLYQDERYGRYKHVRYVRSG